MMHKGKLTLKILLILLATDFLETFTHLCFKKSALPESGFMISSFPDALIFIKSVALSGFLWLGLTSVLLTFIIWSTVLSKIDLSVAVPICSFSYILVPIVSVIFLHEKVSTLRWAGIFFILVGIILVSLSAKKDKTVII
jgi:drug/metabolite transporter (DMT)-like permease